MRVVRLLPAIMVTANLICAGAISIHAENAGVTKASGAEEPAVLTILSSSQRRDITLFEIEALGLHEVTTRSPWDAGELRFEGVLLRDVLRLGGIEKAEAITVRGEDGYTQNIPKEDWEKWPMILATRQDGAVLTRRTQGPTRIVYPLNDYPELDTPDYKPRWVWTVTSIEATK